MLFLFDTPFYSLIHCIISNSSTVCLLPVPKSWCYAYHWICFLDVTSMYGAELILLIISSCLTNLLLEGGMWIEKLQVEIIETRNRHRIDSGGLSVNTAASSLIFHSPFVPQAKREGNKDFFFLRL